MEQLFVIVQRNLSGEVHVETTSDFLMAVYKQKALLAGCSVEQIKPLVTQQEIKEVEEHLNNHHQDRLFNDEEEVTIIFFPKREFLR